MRASWRTLLFGSLAMSLGAVGTVDAQTSQPVPKEIAQVLAEAAKRTPPAASAQPPAMTLVVLQTEERALVDSKPVPTKEVVAYLATRSTQGRPPMVSIQSCAKVPADAVQGLVKGLQAQKFMPAVDLNNPDARHCAQ
jgi:biopolymer transport protein ExbD